MATESKKLQTVDRGGWLAEAGTPNLRASQPSIAHDARIAHEQREVIALLCKALRGHERADVALSAAAPFLEG